MTTTQQTVLDALKKYGPLPDHALVPLVQHIAPKRMSSSSIRSRRSELANSGKVILADTVRMPSGRKAGVWKAV